MFRLLGYKLSRLFVSLFLVNVDYTAKPYWLKFESTAYVSAIVSIYPLF